MKKNILIILSIFLTLIFASLAWSKVKDLETEPSDTKSLLKPMLVGVPNVCNRVHNVGNVWFCISNWGFFGSWPDDSQQKVDCTTNKPAPSFQFPAGSQLEYLFQGALWISAVADGETLTSVGADGWFRNYEMYPAAIPDGQIIERTTRPNSPLFDTLAISEQDFIAVYTDTLTASTYVNQDQHDGRPHHPINIEITQKSYAWSYEYAQDFVIIDFVLKNIGGKRIKDMYMGIYVDADVWHHVNSGNGAQDDICGFREWVTSPLGSPYQDTINVAWIADNDGDPDKTKKVFDNHSPTGVAGTRVVRSPNPDLRYSFNWFISNVISTNDWGPWKAANLEAWTKACPYGYKGQPCNSFPDGALGTPGGDKSKYFMMKNGEFDYDQIFCAVDHREQGWLSPPGNAADLADGYDTRYLLSFGPFNMIPGDSLLLTIAQVGGDNFHVGPTDFSSFNINNPQPFYDKLDFTDFATNAQWAAWVYDNPGVDTDSLTDPLHYRGKYRVIGNDTVYYEGDGVPDFKGPPPPPPPSLNIETAPSKMKISWNGKATELYRDPFTAKRDFEGYRIYISKTGLLEDYALLGSFDLMDYKQYGYDKGRQRWVYEEPSLSYCAIKKKYGTYCDPELFNSPQKAFNYLGKRIYFEHQDWNKGLRDIKVYKEYADTVQAFLDSICYGLMDSATASARLNDFEENEVRFWDYEYELEGLLPSQPFYIVVTGFDYGNPQTSLGPLESSRLVNAKLVYATAGTEEIKKSKPKVVVYPNPYKWGSYSQFEPNAGREDYDHRLNFANLPAKCVIRIFTLSGDLVKELEHNKSESDPTAGYESWNLISRNLQAVVSGVYLYSVESAEETQVGKFVIIK